MSGLDPTSCKIMEIAAVVTDFELNKLGEFHSVVFQPKEVLEAMDAWCVTTHGKSGLSNEVLSAPPLSEVEKKLIAFTEGHFPQGKAILAGNSIWQDRRFVDLHLVEFAKLLHYRMIDVSAFKEIFKTRFKISFKKSDAHRAKSDIHESIGELAHYLKYINPLGEASPKAL